MRGDTTDALLFRPGSCSSRSLSDPVPWPLPSGTRLRCQLQQQPIASATGIDPRSVSLNVVNSFPDVSLQTLKKKLGSLEEAIKESHNPMPTIFRKTESVSLDWHGR